MPNPSPMSMADFANKFRDKMRDTMPEVDSYNDIKVFNMALKSNPELEQIVANPRYNAPAAAAEQYKTKDVQRAQLGPMRAITGQLPTVGAMIGGTLGTSLPGYGTAIGGGLGAYGGTNLEHFANQLMGIDSPNQSFGSTQQDAAIQGAMAGGTNAAMQAISEATGPAKVGINTVRNILLSKMGRPGRMLGSILPDFSSEMSAPNIPTAKPTSSGPQGFPVHEAVGEEVPHGGIRMEGVQEPVGPAGKGYTDTSYTVQDTRPRLGAARGDRALPESASGPTVTEVPPKRIGPARTRFTTEANANPDARALESPEAITESKIKATIDAIEKENAPAPKASRTEADTLEHLKDTPQSTSQAARSGTQVSSPLIRQGDLVMDTNEATNHSVNRVLNEGFKFVGFTDDGHLMFRK